MKWQVCLISFLLSFNKQQKFYIQSILFVLSSLQPQVNWLSTFRLIYEKVSTKIDVRLLAGKFGPICIEFSPAIFFGKNLNNASWKNARQKIIKKHLMQKIVEFSLSLSKRKKNQNHLESSVSIFLRLNFLARDVWKFQTKEHHG